MSSPLPSLDPYKVLGLAKDAALPDIRSAHRKLVLKCHPDKVQDAALKAIKQDEFQRVQQAYELLSDDTRRTQYDEQQKLFELRKEMGRSGPMPGNNVFDYEIRTAEPRTTTFRSNPKETTRVYTQPSRRSYEDDLGSRSYEEPLKARVRKTASSDERKRPVTRDEEKRRKADEDREHDRLEKEVKRNTHNAAKKSRDKDRRKESESKHSRTAFIVDEDDSDDTYRPRPEKSGRSRSDDELRARDELARAAERLRKEDLLQTERTRKLHAHKDFAAQYMQAARRKAEPEPEVKRKPVRRAETFQDPSYSVRYTQSPPQPYVEEEDLPRRSSARRASEHSIPIRSRERPRSPERSRKTSPSYEPFIVDAAPSAPQIKVPTLQTHSSAPLSPRKEPHRSKTMDYSRNTSTLPPPLPRASTFQNIERNKPVSRGSHLKRTVEYDSDGSDSDVPYNSPRAITPPPRRRDPSPTRYVIEKGRSIPLNRHRSELRDDDFSTSRARSESPMGGGGRRSTDRPPLVRSSGSGAHQSFSRPSYYKGSVSPEPIIKEVRPKMAPRESSSRSTSSRGPFFGEVKYAPNYGPEHVSYTPTDSYRRGSDPTNHRDYGYPPRPSAYV